MSDIFGGTATPSWMAPEERTAILSRVGESEAASFNQAFSQSMSRLGQMGEMVLSEGLSADKAAMDRNRIASKMGPITDAFKDIKTPEDAFGIISKHPEWLTDPDTSRGVNQYMNWQSDQLRIKEQADAAALRADTSSLSRDRQKYVNSWDEFMGKLPPEKLAQIQALDDEGWNMDKQGRKLGPSLAAIQIGNQGLKPEETFGFKGNAVISAKTRGEEARKTEGVKQENRTELQDQKLEGQKEMQGIREAGWEKRQAQRQADREKLATMGQQYRIDIEKMREAAKLIPKEQDFIRSLLTPTKKNVDENWDDKRDGGKKTPERVQAKAIDLLKKAYADSKPEPAAAPAPQSSTNSTPAVQTITTKSGKKYQIETQPDVVGAMP